MEKTNCQAYINEDRCAGLMHKNCDGCKFYKSKDEYDREIKKAYKLCKEKGIHTYDDFFKSYKKRKDEVNERTEDKS